MTKISKKSAYPVKIPVRKDYFVGTDSENNGKTVNFDFESTAKLINELNGTPILNYIFKTDNNIPLAVLTEGVFLSEGNETTVANISKLYINKKNFHEENMSDLFRFIAVNRESFLMKLRNSSNLANGVYFKITDATEFQDHFILDVSIELSNTAVPELVNFNVYFFDFELNSASVGSGSSSDGFLETGTIQKVGSTVSIDANSFKWRINSVEYLTTSAFSQVINTAADGYYRIDLLVANTSGGYTLIEGTESIDIVSKPDLPANTLEVTFIPVFGSSIGNITPSPDNSIAKQVSDTLIGNGQMDLVKGQVGNGTDFFRIRFGQNSQDDAELEIATADNGDEPIYFRQYQFTFLPDGTYIPFSTVVNEVAILDENGDTRIPNDLYVNNQLFIPSDYYTKTEIDTSLGNKENTSNKSQDIEADKTSTTKYSSVKQLYDWAVSKFQAVLVSGTNIKTINGTSILGSGDIAIGGGGGGDMTTTTDQTVSGIKTFLSGKIGFRNVANTFTSFFTNANTASRTYTLPDRSGTLADNTDIASINTGKMNTPAGTANYLSKFLTASTIGLSRLWDTGSKLGIGTTKTPTEDITFGNQTERTIGVEQSSNTNHGKDLILFAGRAINFVEGIGFQPLNFGNSSNFNGSIVLPSTQDVYVATTGDIVKRTSGLGTFVSDSSSTNAIFHRGMGVDIYNNIYCAIATGGFKKKTNNTGSWVQTTATGTSGTPTSIAGDYLGNLYFGTDNGLYKQTGLTGSFALIYAFPVRGITVSPVDGSIYIITGAFDVGEIRKQTAGTGSFNLIQNNGYCTCLVASTSGDVYFKSGSDKMWKQTSGTGLFVDTTISIQASSFAISSNGSIYAPCSLIDIFYLDNNAVGTVDLNGGTKSERAGTGKGAGQSRWDVWTGQKTASGTNMQVLTKRIEVDELGAFLLLTPHVYDNNAAAVTAGLRNGSLYWTSTGDLKIVI